VAEPRDRWNRTPGLIATACAVLLAAPAPQPAEATPSVSAPSLLINQDFPDPDILKLDTGYFAFSTSSTAGKVPVASAPKPEGPWAMRGDALAKPPSWAAPGSGYWAPDVSRRADGTFLLLYSATTASTGRMCVGAATATAVTGPYQPAGDAPLVCVTEDGGDIDPQVFTDTDGTGYLLYKSDGSKTGAPAAIWLQKTSPDGLASAGQRVELLRADLTAENAVVEAPSIVKQPSRFLLFYSADTFQNTGYHTSYATAPTLQGPFVKADAPLLSTGGLGGKVDAPGGADVVDDHVYFHGWLNPDHRVRGLYTLPIRYQNELPQLG
jgi:arabinan endo-1,5-alpha-L-arabinosidase